MKELKKLQWSKPTDDKKNHVSSSIEFVLFCLAVLGCIASGITEYSAIYSMTESVAASLVWIFIIEVSYSMFFGLSALLFVYWLTDKKTKSFLVLSIACLLIGLGIFYVSRTLSNQGKDILIDKYYVAPVELEADTTLYNLNLETALSLRKSKIDSVDVLYSTLLSDKENELHIRKKRNKNIAFKYGLSNIDSKISEYSGTNIEWKTNTAKILKRDKKELRAILKRFKQSNKESKAIALKQVESVYNDSLSSYKGQFSALIKDVDTKNELTSKNFGISKNSHKKTGSIAILVFLGIAMLFPFCVCVGRYWAGRKPEFKEVHKGSHLYLIGILFQGYRAKSYNWTAEKVQSQIGDVIEVKQYEVTTKKQKTALKDIQKKISNELNQQEHNENVARLKSEYEKVLENSKHNLENPKQGNISNIGISAENKGKSIGTVTKDSKTFSNSRTYELPEILELKKKKVKLQNKKSAYKKQFSNSKITEETYKKTLTECDKLIKGYNKQIKDLKKLAILRIA